MPVHLKDVKGLFPEKKKAYLKEPTHDSNLRQYWESGSWEGYNQAIDLQGSKYIGLNRERLAEKLRKKYYHLIFPLASKKDFQNWGELEYKYKKPWLEDADEFIAKENELLEVKE